jgi:hypothetical protein
VPAGYAQQIGGKLALHGIAFEKIGPAFAKVDVQAFRASRVEFSRTPFEGRMTLKLEGSWRTESREVPAGSLFVPVNQPRARLLMALLEPRAPDSFASWGFFNGCFEHKEYLEPYVLEIVAQDMLAQDPGLATEFARKLKEDPAFERDPAARREFFHRRHASWDDRHNLYPIYRIDRTLDVRAA